MAARVEAVRAIAIAKRGVKPRLTASGYRAVTARALPPVGFREGRDAATSRASSSRRRTTSRPQTTAKQLVAEQLAAFKERFATVEPPVRPLEEPDAYDVLIIASMIEKEAVVPAERPPDRCGHLQPAAPRMPLGIDATIRYGLNIPGTQSLTKAALASSSPYNTRRFPGLPPTPIANPGIASIRAAAHPARVDYLYFVRKPDKRHHFFTADENEFLRKVCEYGFGCNDARAADALAPRAPWSCAARPCRPSARWSAGSRSAFSHSGGRSSRRARSCSRLASKSEKSPVALSAFMAAVSTQIAGDEPAGRSGIPPAPAGAHTSYPR